MKYQIKGNYFNGSFHLPPISGPLAVENIIKRFCPADTSMLLSETPIDYKDVDRVIESSKDGFKIWKSLGS
jgi:hypothetical protein